MADSSISGLLPAAAAFVELDPGVDTAVQATVTGTFVGTITFQILRNGTEGWVTAPQVYTGEGAGSTATLTAPGTRFIGTAGVLGLRAAMTAYTSGTAEVTFAGTPGINPAAAAGGGGGGAMTVADGADVALGTTTDVGIITNIAGTVIGFLRGLVMQSITLLSRWPAALGSTTAANSLPVTLSTDGTFATLEGPVNEAAPATDTASSGLNGRLQRVAQRLTSLIAQLPAALGTTTAANSLPVTLASDGQFVTSTGSLTEAAPGTDTASSGLNGRLQRIAQRLTSLIAQFPAALVGGRLDVNLGQVPGVVSSVNSSTATLANAAVFTGTGEDVTAYASIQVAVFADQSSAASGLSCQWSEDNTNWDFTQAFTITLNIGQVFTFHPRSRFFRIVYTNGGVTQTAFRLQTIYHPLGLPGGMGLSAQQSQGAGANQTAVVGNPNWIAASTTAAGGNLQGLVVESAAQPNLRTGIWNAAAGPANVGTSADAQNSAGQALLTNSQGALYNGATMDRARNNIDVTLLASAARTTTQGPTNLVTYNAGAIQFILDMTTIGTGSVTLTINEVDVASGKSILLLSGAAVVSNSTNVYTIDPIIASVANVSKNARTPRTLSYTVTANNANSAVYSLGAMVEIT